jgi:signal recognition particle subunit SEC65
MPDHFFVYPTYLGQGRSRRDGRRLPADRALVDVTADEIAGAAKRLGFKAEIEAAKQYPREPHLFAGRVKVAKKPGTSKTAFLRAVAGELARERARAGKK